MHKNEFTAKMQSVVIEAYHELREHHVYYGSLTLAGIAVGIHFARKHRVHQEIDRDILVVQHQAENILENSQTPRNAA